MGNRKFKQFLFWVLLPCFLYVGKTANYFKTQKFKKFIIYTNKFSGLVQSTQEIYTIKLNLNFSDDPFKTYTCQARKDDQILAMKSMDVRNPFFLESHGDCGAQLARNENLSARAKRSPMISGIIS